MNVELGLPQGVELLGYQRSGNGHALEVRFLLPEFCRCEKRGREEEKCGREEAATNEFKNTVYVLRDLDLWGQPSFPIFQPWLHGCLGCGHRRGRRDPKRPQRPYLGFCT